MTRQLLKSTAVVGGMTLISRVAGLVRDIMVARLAGATVGSDAFFVAFKIPNFLRRLFAEGAFAQAFVPVLAEARTKGGEAGTRHLVDCVSGSLGLVLSAVTVVGVIAAPVLIWVFAPGFTADEDKYALTVGMLRVTFPYILFISLTACAGGILNTYGRFAVPAFTPVFLNLSLIVAALWWAPHFDEPVVALAWGVFIAGIVQLAFQLPSLARLGLLPRPRADFRDPEVRKIMRLMVPGIVGSSATQINLLVDTIIASFLVTGSVTWLYYADRMVEFPLGVFGVALGTVILPGLSKRYAEQDGAGYSATLDWALRWALLISVPSAAALMILAGPVLIALFQHGAFTVDDAWMSARALVAYTLGLVAFTAIKVLAPAFYARQDPRTPVRIALLAVAVNLALGVTLALGLGMGHVGLAGATAAAACVNAGLLGITLCKRGFWQPGADWPRHLRRIGIATAAMAAVLALGVFPWEAWAAQETSTRLARLALWVAAGGAVYFGVLWAMGERFRTATR